MKRLFPSAYAIRRIAAFWTATRLILFCAVLLAASSSAVLGQSALDGFDPNANGTIRVVVVQPDGKILLGGDFTSVAPNGGAAVTRNHIARLNPDGTLDAAFNPNANETVYSIAVQADGKILVGGAFYGVNSIGGRARNGMARVDSINGLADSFAPEADNVVQAIAVQPDGKTLLQDCLRPLEGRRAIASPGLTPPPRPLIHSTRTQTGLSMH